jgi:hypothetical protein
MKITATIDPKIALANGKSQAGRQELDLDVAMLTAAERALLAYVSVSKSDGLEMMAHYQHTAHNMSALDLESLRAYLARIADRQASDAAAKVARFSLMRQSIMAGELPAQLKSGYATSTGISCDQYQELIDMPETRALMAAAAKSAAKSAADSEAAAKAAAAAKSAAEQAARDEMLAWIAAHGSPHLRRCIAEGIECRSSYQDERLAAERPGWRWYDDVRGTFEAPSNPPAEAFALLDAARKIAPDAKLGWYTAEEETDDYGEVTADKWEGYVAHAEFFGRTVIFGVPTE